MIDLAPPLPANSRATPPVAASGLDASEPWRRRLRLRTQVRLRWLAVLGQLVAVLVAWLVLGFPFPVAACLVVIACSALLNLMFELRSEGALRLTPRLGMFLLAFDVVQVCALLFLTGGAENPFMMLAIGPVVISASTLPGRYTALLSALVAILVTGLTLASYPLPWFPGTQLVLPDLYVLAHWVAVLVTLGFTVVYVWRVAEESRELAGALAATELALEREQHLSALDGLAAGAAHELGTPLATIALVAKEMQHAAPARRRSVGRGRRPHPQPGAALPRDPPPPHLAERRRRAAGAAGGRRAGGRGRRTAPRVRRRHRGRRARGGAGARHAAQRGRAARAGQPHRERDRLRAGATSPSPHAGTRARWC